MVDVMNDPQIDEENMRDGQYDSCGLVACSYEKYSGEVYDAGLYGKTSYGYGV